LQLLVLPTSLNGSLRLFPPHLLGCNGIFHCPCGPPACVAGDARTVARESPGRDGFARPRAVLPPLPSVIPLRALVTPFPSPWVPDWGEVNSGRSEAYRSRPGESLHSPGVLGCFSAGRGGGLAELQDVHGWGDA
jgi:hypothetical protein